MSRSKAIRLALISGLIASVAGAPAADELDDQYRGVQAQFEGGQIGHSVDQFLVRRNTLGEMEPVSVIFGMADDEGFCEQIARSLMTQYRREHYACRPAN